MRHALIAAATAGLTGAALWRSRAALPASVRQRWERTNHAGRSVSMLEGPMYAAAAAAGVLAPAFVPRSVTQAEGGQAVRPAPALLSVVGAAGFGAFDDLAGDSTSKGLRGHVGALARGEVTTGAIKIIGIGATGLVTAALVDRGNSPGLMTVLSTVIGGAGIAGSANLANLLDLRPGRALKVTAATAAIALIPPAPSFASTQASREHSSSSISAAAALGAAGAMAPADLAGAAMLGDTGANAAGALLGTAVVQRCGLRGRCALLAGTAALTLLSERVSFSSVIEGNRYLRRLDGLGRS